MWWKASNAPSTTTTLTQVQVHYCHQCHRIYSTSTATPATTTDRSLTHLQADHVFKRAVGSEAKVRLDRMNRVPKEHLEVSRCDDDAKRWRRN